MRPEAVTGTLLYLGPDRALATGNVTPRVRGTLQVISAVHQCLPGYLGTSVLYLGTVCYRRISHSDKLISVGAQLCVDSFIDPLWTWLLIPKMLCLALAFVETARSSKVVRLHLGTYCRYHV